MATIPRPRRAKSGSDWDEIDLAAYNIRVEFQDATSFFETPHLPDPVLTAKEVLEVATASQTTTDDGYALLRVLEAAMYPRQNEESAVQDFAAELFRACGYTGRGRIVRTRKDIYFSTCREHKYLKADACILLTWTRSFYSFMKTNVTSIMPFSPVPSVNLSPKRSQLSPQTRMIRGSATRHYTNSKLCPGSS